ncbi:MULTISPECIES: hypothetical protein [Sphingobium]|uniref:Cytochrome c n=1 Tax=Sphingobium cupriresistens TaxID=1132417 RepID=A0A8G1ZDH4_9SPHN|nr:MULTISPECIES: hypothetical protein [Sphingobium]RYM08163.1 hypothetical protein EWH12_17485 [Sphingobium cupriresistens]WCP12947.1 hypothetical protein sphantq_01360 [Sphingobium sp. AntQ-1]
MRRRPAALAALLLLPPGAAFAQEDHSALTRAKYVRNCLMCHNRAAPEGVSPAILAGLYPERGLTPVMAMPGVTCWRRCDRCFAPDRRDSK